VPSLAGSSINSTISTKAPDHVSPLLAAGSDCMHETVVEPERKLSNPVEEDESLIADAEAQLPISPLKSYFSEALAL
jgi:hypothetical protein